MLGALGRLFDRGGGDPLPPAGHIPADLVEAIGATMAQPRGEPDPETGDVRVLVKVAGLGAWYWEGVNPAADRIARHYPELPSKTCRRAAQLLASVLASRNRAERMGPKKRGGWVWDLDLEL